MRVRIYRGTHEVGGNCVELEAGGQRNLLDLGMPLNVSDPSAVELPDVSGLDGSDESLLAVVLSHPHFVHYGLATRLPSNIVIFIGADADRLLRASVPFTTHGVRFAKVVHYRHREPFDLGPFRVTPFLNDHSAFDAYSLLVEVDGRTLFYTGDFRAHGRKSSLFGELLESGPKKVNVLLTEGTTISRTDDEPSKSEQDLEEEIVRSLSETRGIALAYFSAQNIDRFVTFFKASKKSGRTFVVDVYLAQILDALDRSSLPDPRSSDLLVFLPYAMKKMIKETQNFELVNPYYSRRIYPEALAAEAGHLTMLFRPSMRYELERAGCLSGAKVLYSLWPGYLERGGFDLRAWCVSHGVTFEMHHTSGHAAVPDLKRLVAALQPERVVPIHTFAPERFSDLFPNVQQVNDGEWWEV